MSRRPVIVAGREAPLSGVPFHHDGPLRRWLMASAELHPDLHTFVAVHQFTDVPAADRDYCEVHSHPFDELNVLHTTTALRVALTLGDETVEVDAPATVLIPAGTPHAANVIEGTGVLVAILYDGTWTGERR